MLERAKACLQSGARESLRCAQPTHRSKRMLHSTFWNHGAGDLDLPPSAVPTSLISPGVPPTDDSRGQSGNGGKQAEVHTPGDGVFLDFLYPPQALALLARINGQHGEIWEGRNARRLPTGFVQMSRGYASRTKAHAAVANAGVDEGHGYRRGEAMKKLGIPRDDRMAAVVLAQLNVNSGKHVRRDGDNATQTNDLADVELADSPADLAEASAESLQRLLTMLRISRESRLRGESRKGRELAKRVLQIYDSLDDLSKADVRLKMELLDWLSVYPDADAALRCANLYGEIPVSNRNLPVYKAALTVFLRRDKLIEAFNLLREALRNIGNGDQVAKDFFQYAVDHGRWALAMNIEIQYCHTPGQLPRTSRHSMFWLLVSNIPGLLPKALELAKHLRVLNRAKTVTDEFRKFCANFFKEALVQEFQASDGVKTEPSFDLEKMPNRQIGRLFEYMTALDDEAPRIHEELIMAMIGPNARYPYTRKMHRIVSYAYLELHRMEGYMVPTDMLMALLERLTRYWDEYRPQSERHHSLRISAITNDWVRYHGKLPKAAVAHLLTWHALSGHVDRFATWLEYLHEQYPGYEQQKDILWTTIYLHARRADLSKAKAAFDAAMKASTDYGEPLPLKCWNVLLHAYSRNDELEGAVDVLTTLIGQGLKPDEYSFHPVMEMMAKRGDVEGVRDLLSQYDALAGERREAAFFGSLLTALVNCGQIEETEEILKTVIEEVKKGNVRGSLTGCFNIVLTAHALRREVNATMLTYRWMKDEGVRVNADTFAALIQALTLYRQTDSAYKILRTAMKDHKVKPTAFHYALVMTGYVNQGMYAEALRVHGRMQSQHIKSTFSSNAAYLKAKALKEHIDSSRVVGKGKYKRRVVSEPLHTTTRELEKILQASQGKDLAAKQPHLGLRASDERSDFSAAYFNFLIYIHGQRRCFQAVQQLYEKYKSHAVKGEASSPRVPISLLTALMSAHLRAGDYEGIEACWKMAKEQADEFTRTVSIPQLKPSEGPGDLESPDLLCIEPMEPDDAQEVGFQIADRASPGPSGAPENDRKTTLLTDKHSGPSAHKPTPGRSWILSRPLRFYLYALSSQNRLSDMISVVAQLFHQGYTMDNRTWNAFICLLSSSKPPLTLLAFTLTERFLIPHFPGWTRVRKTHHLDKSEKLEGLEYIRARYLRPGQLIPQYQTLVTLGSALLELKRVEATGRRGVLDLKRMKGVERYVGSMKQVRKQAPKTLFAIQSMPTVDDKPQNQILRRRPR